MALHASHIEVDLIHMADLGKLQTLKTTSVRWQCAKDRMVCVLCSSLGGVDMWEPLAIDRFLDSHRDSMNQCTRQVAEFETMRNHTTQETSYQFRRAPAFSFLHFILPNQEHDLDDVSLMKLTREHNHFVMGIMTEHDHNLMEIMTRHDEVPPR